MRITYSGITLACVFVTCFGAPSVHALKYVENLADNPEASLESRLERLDLRQRRQIERMTRIAQASTAFETAIAKGNAANVRLQAQQEQFQQSVESTTVAAALGEGEPRGLSWLCSRARQVISTLERIKSAASPALQDYQADIQDISPGSENAAENLLRREVVLSNAMGTILPSADEQTQLRLDLKEIDLGLQHALGSRSTLQLMADPLMQTATEVITAAARLQQSADSLKEDLTTAVDEQQNMQVVLESTRPLLEYPGEIALHAALEKRLRETRPVTTDTEAMRLVEQTREASTRWLAAGESANALVKTGVAPLASAASACAYSNDPVRDFAAARDTVQKSLETQIAQVESVLDAKLNTLAGLQQQAQEIAGDNRRTLAELDVKIETLQVRLDADNGQNVRWQVMQNEALKLRNEAAKDEALMQQAEREYAAQAAEVKRQRGVMQQLRGRLLVGMTDQ